MIHATRRRRALRIFEILIIRAKREQNFSDVFSSRFWIMKTDVILTHPHVNPHVASATRIYNVFNLEKEEGYSTRSTDRPFSVARTANSFRAMMRSYTMSDRVPAGDTIAPIYEYSQDRGIDSRNRFARNGKLDQSALQKLRFSDSFFFLTT